MARRNRLRNQAQAQAAAAAAPQRHAVHRQLHASRRDERYSARSLRSANAAMQDAITTARREVRRTPGLLPTDRGTALASLSAARVSAAAGSNFQVAQVHREAAGVRSDLHQSLTDIASEQGTATSAALADLVEAAKARHATHSENVAGRKFDARQGALDRAATLKAAGATDKKAHKDDFKAAKTVAENLYQIAKAKGVEPYTEEQWAQFAEAVGQDKGVDSPQAAQDAVDLLRKHAVARILQAASLGTYTPPRK